MHSYFFIFFLLLSDFSHTFYQPGWMQRVFFMTEHKKGTVNLVLAAQIKSIAVPTLASTVVAGKNQNTTQSQRVDRIASSTA